MGKIIAVLIALTMLVGCSTATQSEYLKEMREVTILMDGTIGEVSDALKSENSGKTLFDLHYRLGLIEGKAKNIEPAKNMVEYHNHYLKFIVAVKDSVAHVLNNDSESYNKSLDEGKKELKLAKPLLDKIKGE